MIKIKDLEHLRIQANMKFDRVRGTMLDACRWALPHRGTWLAAQTPGERNNQHIVDGTHVLALRSFVAGFLEGNTSATRPWYRSGTNDVELNNGKAEHKWLDGFTRRTLQILQSSNFYHAAGALYYDYGVVNTGAYYIDEIERGLFFHVLMPGSYKVINNGYGEAVVLVREFQLNVKAVVDTYGKMVDGKPDWSNFSGNVRKLYEDGVYTEMVDIVHVVKENSAFDPTQPVAMLNKKWCSYTYEIGSTNGSNHLMNEGVVGEASYFDEKGKDRFLKVVASKRKPFIVAKSDPSPFEYGLKGPTTDSLGIIKSLNKKAIAKDVALDLMIQPPMQGPANLRKSYISAQSRAFVPLDASSSKPGGGLRSIFEVNPAMPALVQDVTDLRQMVEKFYYADFLLFLMSNPKTRTATEVDGIQREQQLVIGPNLQSLNWSHNVPLVEFVMDYVLFDDPWIDDNPMPDSMAGKFVRPEFISVFAQSQRAADLPAIDRYIAAMTNIGQLKPEIWDKVNLDKLADLYEDRLYLPAGLNNPQAEVEAKREQAMAQAKQQQMLQETLPAMAGAASDLGINAGADAPQQ